MKVRDAVVGVLLFGAFPVVLLWLTAWSQGVVMPWDFVWKVFVVLSVWAVISIALSGLERRER